MGWGVTTGAVTGAVTGAALGLYGGLNLGFALAGALYGVVIGFFVSVVPTAVASSVVLGMLQRRHPHPSSPDSVRRDLGVAFGLVVFVLDAVFLLAVFAGGEGLDSVVSSLPLVAVATVCVAAMLWPARTSISKAWSGG